MHDPNYGSEDMYGYDEPTLPYIDQQANQNMRNTVSTEPIEVPRTPHDSSHLQSLIEPQASTYYTNAETATFVPGVGEQPVPDTEVVPALPRRRSRRALWITLASVFVLLLIAAGSTYELVSYLNRSTPVKTLDTFCSALQKEDYGSAYNQFSKYLQSQFTEQDFAGLIRQDKVTSCTHGKADDKGVRVTTSLTLKHADNGVNNDLVILAKGADSIWLIDDLQRAS